MVVIRLARHGAKKNPFYRVVVADHRRACTRRYIEQLGYYNPTARGSETPLQLDLDRVAHWEKEGAQLSDRVAFLVKNLRKGVTLESLERMADLKAKQFEKAEELQKKKLTEEKKAADQALAVKAKEEAAAKAKEESEAKEAAAKAKEEAEAKKEAASKAKETDAKADTDTTDAKDGKAADSTAESE